MDDPLTAEVGPRLRVGYVPGVQPDKWLGRWRERTVGVPVSARRDVDPLRLLCRDPGAATAGPGPGSAAPSGPSGYDVAFVRELDSSPRSAPEGLLRIPLYTETMAVLAPRDHEVSAFESLTTGDLAGQAWLDPVDPLAATTEDVSAAADLVAAGVGLLGVPMPYARQLSRRDLVARELTDAPATRIGIAWAVEREGDRLIDAFVGIVRGRTAASSRGVSTRGR